MLGLLLACGEHQHYNYRFDVVTGRKGHCTFPFSVFSFSHSTAFQGRRKISQYTDKETFNPTLPSFARVSRIGKEIHYLDRIKSSLGALKIGISLVWLAFRVIFSESGFEFVFTSSFRARDYRVGTAVDKSFPPFF